MSTRCNIIIKDQHDQTIFYRHSDGYPSGVLPALCEFMHWVKEGKIRDNVEQSAGWLILIGAREYDQVYVKNPGEYSGHYEQKTDITKPDPRDPGFEWKHGAYEISTCIHSDIEFLYTLDLHEKSILIEIPGFNKDGKYTPGLNTTIGKLKVFSPEMVDQLIKKIKD